MVWPTIELSVQWLLSCGMRRCWELGKSFKQRIEPNLMSSLSESWRSPSLFKIWNNRCQETKASTLLDCKTRWCSLGCKCLSLFPCGEYLPQIEFILRGRQSGKMESEKSPVDSVWAEVFCHVCDISTSELLKNRVLATPCLCFRCLSCISESCNRKSAD